MLGIAFDLTKKGALFAIKALSPSSLRAYSSAIRKLTLREVAFVVGRTSVDSVVCGFRFSVQFVRYFFVLELHIFSFGKVSFSCAS